MQLFDYQAEFLYKIINSIYNGKNIIIHGKSGCGKSFTLKHISSMMDQKAYQVLYFDGDYQYDDREYYPFKKTLFGENTYNDIVVGGIVEASKEIPMAGGVVSYIIKSFSDRKFSKNKMFLNHDEQNILAKLRQKIKKYHTILIFDNIHWWDRRSLQFLRMLMTTEGLLSKNDYMNLTFIFSITSDQEMTHADLLDVIVKRTEFEKYDFPTIGYIEFKEILLHRTFQQFSEKQIQLLFHLVNGHMQVFFEVISEIINNNFDFDSNYNNNKDYLSNVLDKRLKEDEADGLNIIKTLEYASIMGMTFSIYELKNITSTTENEINEIINRTSTLSITENADETNYIKFAHDIIREIFKNKVDKYHVEYYKSLSLCIKEIKPDQYLRRARYLMKCLEFDDAVTQYLLEAVKQIRLYGEILETIYMEMLPLLNELQINYIKIMKNSYELYSQKKYMEASTKLNLILDVHPLELLAERDILKIRCYSKNLASNEVQEQIKKYNSLKKENSFNDEKDVWERYSQALMIAYAHLGDISTARDIEKEILLSLSVRLKYDNTASNRLNIVKRVANSIHNIDVSAVFVKDSFEYFGYSTNGIRDIRQFYMSLANYSTILINQGDFASAYDLIIRGFELEDNNNDIDFPRTQLLKNNYILAGYLSNRLNEDECISLYNDLIEELPNVVSERLFYKSNLSVFWALNNNPEKAFNILSNEAQLHYDKDEKEGLYHYRVMTNTAIYLYLLGSKESAIKKLKDISELTKRLINGSYFSKKNELLIKLMESNIDTNGKDILKKLFDFTPVFQDSSWRYFGLAYAFMAVCNWDMSE